MNVAAHTARVLEALLYETHFFFSCWPVCCAVDIARRLFLMTSRSASPYSCPMDQMLSKYTRWDYFI